MYIYNVMNYCFSHCLVLPIVVKLSNTNSAKLNGGRLSSNSVTSVKGDGLAQFGANFAYDPSKGSAVSTRGYKDNSPSTDSGYIDPQGSYPIQQGSYPTQQGFLKRTIFTPHNFIRRMLFSVMPTNTQVIISVCIVILLHI